MDRQPASMQPSSAVPGHTTAEEEGTPWSCLPDVFVRALCGHLCQADTLSARAACRDWATTLTPLIISLRVPIGQPSCSGRRPTHPAAQQLAAALARMPAVSSITLVIAADATAQDLQAALQVVGAQASVREVTILEAVSVMRTHGGEPSLKPRGYAPGLALHHLQHAQVLTLRSLSWSLADIWQQVVCMADAGDEHNSPPGGSRRACHLHTLHVTLHPFSAQRKAACELLPMAAALPAGLRHVTTPLPGQYSPDGAEVVCSLQNSHTDYLQALAACASGGLEGLVIDRDAYQGKYEVLLAFDELQQLSMSFGSMFRSFLSPLMDAVAGDIWLGRIMCAEAAASKLRRLCLHGSDLSPMLPQPEVLQQHEPMFALHWLPSKPAMRELAACICQTDEDLSHAAGQLRSLDAVMLPPSPEVVAQVASIGACLTSLALSDHGSGRPQMLKQERTSLRDLGRPIRWLPMQVHLQSLTNLSSLALVAASNFVAFNITDPRGVWQQLPQLRSLRLRQAGLGYSSMGRPLGHRALLLPLPPTDSEAGDGQGGHSSGAAAGVTAGASATQARLQLWLQDLPLAQLQQLELSMYDIVVGEVGAAATSPAAADMQDESHSSAAGPLHPGLHDARRALAAMFYQGVGMRNLQEDGFPDQHQQQTHRQARAPPQLQASSSTVQPRLEAQRGSRSSSASRAAGLLEVLVLARCRVLAPAVEQAQQQQAQQQQAQQQQAQQQPAAPDAPAGVLEAREVGLTPLLQALRGGPLADACLRLRRLQLLYTHASTADISFLASAAGVGGHLQQLEIIGDSYSAMQGRRCPDAPARSSSGSSATAIDAAGDVYGSEEEPITHAATGTEQQSPSAALAAAAADGQLRQLRSLVLRMCDKKCADLVLPGGACALGLSALYDCCALTHLQELQLDFELFQHASMDSSCTSGCSSGAVAPSCSCPDGGITSKAGDGRDPVLQQLAHWHTIARCLPHLRRLRAGLAPVYGPKAPLWPCSRCGGIRDWRRAWQLLQAGLPFMLPACDVVVHVGGVLGSSDGGGDGGLAAVT